MFSTKAMTALSIVLALLSLCQMGTLVEVDLESRTGFLAIFLMSGFIFLLAVQALCASLVTKMRFEELDDDITDFKVLLYRIDKEIIKKEIQKQAKILHSEFKREQALQSPDDLSDNQKSQLELVHATVTREKRRFWRMMTAATFVDLNFGEKVSYKDFLPGERFGENIEKEIA